MRVNPNIPFQITQLLIPPTVGRQLVSNPITANYDLSSLKGVLIGAAPVRENLIRQLTQKLGAKVDIGQNIRTSWYVNNPSELLALCEGKPTVSGIFPSPSASNVEVWYFWHQQIFELRVFWDAMTVMKSGTTSGNRWLIQSNTTITRSYNAWYCTHHCSNWGRISIRGGTPKIHPIPRPDGRAMGVFGEYFGENWPRYNGTVLYNAIICRHWRQRNRLWCHRGHQFSAMMSLYNTANWFHDSPNVYRTHRTPGGTMGFEFWVLSLSSHICHWLVVCNVVLYQAVL